MNGVLFLQNLREDIIHRLGGQVEIDESGRVLEFSDYVKATDDANSISMKAYKARDVIADSIGSFTLGGNDYSVSCLSYSDSWVLTEVIGDDLR